ncbi:MAG: hypothetical protein QF921_14480 [Pseudomonadales bacterium]|jgi:hypothetical protein|nr:hypothetical protein [Pseudomonadales bacterium]MDP6472668.1 hypothetical protein [Pseudomonadales bacterium]MDP6827880.1 hypothetical protein [Pseudomonadales bacterium]MDP6972688.1 hypothetical protein [Pseudomonadales bacterium]|tara:strand:+ start:897 stop:1316 length:420 start_codon:yes stop_codon:yes gene_type:complete
MSENRPAALYSVTGIVVSAVLVSLGSACVLIVLNYIALGSPTLARKAAWGALAAFVLSAIGVAVLPIRWFIVIAPLVQGLAAWFLTNTLQGDAIRYHIERGAPMHSSFFALGVALLVAFAVMFIMLVSIAILGSLGRIA